ncbi:hypothetical protein REPUB_Repub07fG0151000 [Reevesia pubescens]
MEEKKARKQEKLVSKREIFCHSGPLHLTAVDWKNFHHRRSVAASLVQGVYILERDRQQNRQALQALAPPWWDYFNFQLAVLSIVAVAGTSSIWLAGHSLGSAISLLAGKNVTMMGYSVGAYLFNPPFFSVPVEIIKNEKLKHGIRFTSSIVKAGLAVAVKGSHQRPKQDDPFVLLSAWIPYLFVNPADPICSGYIGYFEHRKKMEKIGAGKIERIATQNSIGSLLSGSLKSDSEPLHLLPSAYLTINLIRSPDFKRAHGIHQWWDPSFDGQSELHEYR